MKRKKKIVCIFGTRPEAIKMAPVVQRLRREKNFFKTVAVVTAQHREMLDQVLRVFRLKPEFDLNIMQENQTLTQITTRVLTRLAELYKTLQPDMVLVHGDTTTALASSIASFYAKVPLGHVEAGLRTFQKYKPYPEEMNRAMTDFLSDIHFAPTETARKNLLSAGMPNDHIFITGNTVIDALLETTKKPYSLPAYWKSVFSNNLSFILVTAHRRESFGKPLKEICAAIRSLVSQFHNTGVIFSVHRNPAVRRTVSFYLKNTPRVFLAEPVDYQLFVHLMRRACLILTDSGGIQEEAPALGIPVLVLREVTERPEAVKAGTVKIIGTSKTAIVKWTSRLFTDKTLYQKMSRAVNPYGDGKAAQRIVSCLKFYFNFQQKKPEAFYVGKTISE